MSFTRSRSIHALMCATVAFCICVIRLAESSDGSKRPVRTKSSSWEISGGPDYVAIPVEAQGSAHTFLLSTSSLLSVFDSSLRGMIMPRETENSGRTTARYSAPAATVGGVPFQFPHGVTCLDLAEIRSANWCSADGLIGMDFLRNNILEIDFDERKAAILDNLPKDAGWRLAVTYTPRAIPLVSGTAIEGKEESFAVITTDTNEMTLRSRLFDALRSSDRITDLSSNAVSTDRGEIEVERGRLDQIEIGGVLYQDLVVSKGPMTCIGNDFLRRHIVVLDLERDRMYFRKGKQFARRDSAKSIGISLKREDDRVIIQDLKSGSICEAAGCRVGDLIVRIDNTVVDLRKHTRQQIQTKMLSNERDITLLLRRNGEDVSVTLPRQPMAPQ